MAEKKTKGTKKPVKIRDLAEKKSVKGGLTGSIPTQLGNLTGPGPGDVFGPSH